MNPVVEVETLRAEVERLTVERDEARAETQRIWEEMTVIQLRLEAEVETLRVTPNDGAAIRAAIMAGIAEQKRERDEVARLQADRDEVRRRDDAVSGTLDEGVARLTAKRDEARADAERMRLVAALYGQGVDPDGNYEGTPGSRVRDLLLNEKELAIMRPVVEAVDRYITADADLDEEDVDSGEWKVAEQERDHAWDALLDAHTDYLQVRARAVDQMAIPTGPAAVPATTLRARSCPTCHSIGAPRPRHEDQLCADPWHDRVGTDG